MNKGTSALHQAANNAFSEILKVLIVKGASINLRDSEGFTPLHMVINPRESRGSHQERVKCIRYLLKYRLNEIIDEGKGDFQRTMKRGNDASKNFIDMVIFCLKFIFYQKQLYPFYFYVT